MKILLVTGQLAQDAVERYSKESGIETEVLALKIAVAAFLTPENIAATLNGVKAAAYDMILVPGMVRGDTSEISRATGIPTFKGPRYAADLPVVLDLLCEVELSTILAADEFLNEKFREKALKEIEKTEQKREELLKKPGSLLIGNVAIGPDFPMRVLAEIVDAATMDKATVQKTAKHFVEMGADIIDVGMVAGQSQPEKAKQIVRWVKEVVEAPVSIDTLDSAEIMAAVEAGVELILSGDAGNIEEIAPFTQEVAVVLIPTNQKQGYFPKETIERVKYLEDLIVKARQLGVKRYLADLIVEPLNVFESFVAFKEFAIRNPDIPMFVGISNVTELFDADSVGINAMLARLSSEVGGSVLLATEKSTKAKGTVAEEVTAAKMMFLSKKRGSAVKDLGVDLLILKDKRSHEEPYTNESDNAAKIVEANAVLEPVSLDVKGMFRINVDRDRGVLVAIHYDSSNPTVPQKVIQGKTADVVNAKIIALGLVSKLDHAAYLGRELAKAEIALQTGKAYVQDTALFKK